MITAAIKFSIPVHLLRVRAGPLSSVLTAYNCCAARSSLTAGGPGMLGTTGQLFLEVTRVTNWFRPPGALNEK